MDQGRCMCVIVNSNCMQLLFYLLCEPGQRLWYEAEVYESLLIYGMCNHEIRINQLLIINVRGSFIDFISAEKMFVLEVEQIF